MSKKKPIYTNVRNEHTGTVGRMVKSRAGKMWEVDLYPYPGGPRVVQWAKSMCSLLDFFGGSGPEVMRRRSKSVAKMEIKRREIEIQGYKRSMEALQESANKAQQRIYEIQHEMRD